MNAATAPSSLTDWMEVQRTATDSLLRDLLARGTVPQPELARALEHALLLGGKRLRPLLALAACEVAHGSEEAGRVAGAAVEMVHTYSLVHDDLPAMDNDALRRGQPTVHVRWDEATAILVGDGLLTLAFEVLAEAPELMACDAAMRLQMVRELARAAGISGMVGGQAMDMAAGRDRTRVLDQNHLAQLHGRKTGALIRASVQLGVLASGHSHASLRRVLDRYAQALGLAFQVVDDILDATGDTQVLGKPAGSDLAGGKQTYVSLLGLDGARREAERLCQEAETALEHVVGAERLLGLIAWVRDRHH